jgi:hypothetical protein
MHRTGHQNVRKEARIAFKKPHGSGEIARAVDGRATCLWERALSDWNLDGLSRYSAQTWRLFVVVIVFVVFGTWMLRSDSALAEDEASSRDSKPRSRPRHRSRSIRPSCG